MAHFEYSAKRIRATAPNANNARTQELDYVFLCTRRREWGRACSSVVRRQEGPLGLPPFLSGEALSFEVCRARHTLHRRALPPLICVDLYHTNTFCSSDTGADSLGGPPLGLLRLSRPTSNAAPRIFAPR